MYARIENLPPARLPIPFSSTQQHLKYWAMIMNVCVCVHWTHPLFDHSSKNLVSHKIYICHHPHHSPEQNPALTHYLGGRVSFWTQPVSSHAYVKYNGSIPANIPLGCKLHTMPFWACSHVSQYKSSFLEKAKFNLLLTSFHSPQSVKVNHVISASQALFHVF